MINSDIISPQIEENKNIKKKFSHLILNFYFVEIFLTKIFQQAENSETEQKQTSRRVESIRVVVKNT